MSEDIKHTPPPFIRSDEELAYYRNICDKLNQNGTLLKPQDTFGLGMLASNLALADFCFKSIQKHGMHIEMQGDRKIVRKANPAIVLQKEAQAAIRHYLKEFQMSPSSRGKGIITPPSGGKGQDDGFDQL